MSERESYGTENIPVDPYPEPSEPHEARAGYPFAIAQPELSIRIQSTLPGTELLVAEYGC